MDRFYSLSFGCAKTSRVQIEQDWPSVLVSESTCSFEAISNETGLDPARYASTTGQVGEKQFFTFESQISDKERFKDVDPLSIRCASCASAFTFEGLLENTVSALPSSPRYHDHADQTSPIRFRQ